MISILSPAKKLNFEKMNRNCESSQPSFKDDASKLAKTAAKLDITELSKLMNISSNLATLNKERFEKFSPNPTQEYLKQAAFAFAGDTYVGLGVDEIDPENDAFLQNNIRILSGLYGVLRPFDLIQPYRLEMGSKLQTREASNLYEFWGDTLAKSLASDLESHRNKILINLASEEYFKVVRRSNINVKVVSPKFFEIRNGEPKIISFYAKKARGLMARFIINNRITVPDGMKDFNLEGYKFDTESDFGESYTFIRKE